MKRYAFTTSDFPSFVGVEHMFDMLDSMVDYKSPTYPPYNIKKVAENQYILEMAVAGFKRSEIDITMSQNVVSIKGKKEEESNATYIHHGIGARAFSNNFPLAENVQVTGASMQDGILQIALERIVPEEMKPKRIEIGESLNTISQPQLLTEEA